MTGQIMYRSSPPVHSTVQQRTNFSMEIALNNLNLQAIQMIP